MKHFLSLFLLLCPSFALAQVMDESFKTELVEDYSGGMNNTIQGNKLSNKFSPFISNLLVDEKKGMLTQVKGFTILGATVTLSSINFFEKLARENEQDVYYLSDSSQVLSTLDFQTYRFVRGGLNTACLPSGVQVRDDMWITNGCDSVFTDNGSTVTVLDGKTYSGLATPCVPKGKYIAYDQNIPWIANSTFSQSAVHFAALTDTSGNAIAPDNSAAWPLTNQLNVNQGDGFPITSLWSYNGLYVGKQNAIYKRSGIDADTYRFDQTRAEAGPISNDSVAHGDNLTYFKGYRGAYKFNGSEAVRFTDGIQEDMDLVENNVANIVKNIWDTPNDFMRGTIGGGTFTASGIEVTSGIYVNSRVDPKPQYPMSGLTTTGDIPITNVAISNSDFFEGYVSFLHMDFTNNNAGAGCVAGTSVTLTNLRTGASSVTFVTQSGSFEKFIHYAPGQIEVTKDDIDLSSFVYKVDVNLLCEVVVSSIGAPGAANVVLANTTAQYLSEIATVATITAWDKFNAIQNNSGGSINYFVRTATNVQTIVNKAWTPILSGNVINSTPTQNYVQWATTMVWIDAPAQLSGTPNIDQVTIAHNESGLLETRPIAAFWENRYWLGVTTITSGSTSIVYLKSRASNENPDAIVRRDGLSIRSFLNGNDIFYAGSSTAGVILRLDNGNTDNARSINFSYETPELRMGNYFFDKKLQKFMIEAESDETLTLNADVSIDSLSYSTRTVSLTGIGRQYREINNLDGLDCKYVKFKISGNNSGPQIRLGTLLLFYLNTQSFRENE